MRTQAPNGHTRWVGHENLQAGDPAGPHEGEELVCKLNKKKGEIENDK